MKDVDCAIGAVPPGYHCASCGAHVVKLWRPYHGVGPLRCVACAEQHEGKRLAAGGREPSDQIGWYIPAVPLEDGLSFYGYTSVPDAGVAWWKALPMALPTPRWKFGPVHGPVEVVDPATDADIAREFFRRFGPCKVMVGSWCEHVAHAEEYRGAWSSALVSGPGDPEKHATGEEGFVAALERALELVRKGGG